jgi:hypothetical protein
MSLLVSQYAVHWPGFEVMVKASVFHPSIFTFHSTRFEPAPAIMSDGIDAVSSRSSPGINSM